MPHAPMRWAAVSDPELREPSCSWQAAAIPRKEEQEAVRQQWGRLAPLQLAISWHRSCFDADLDLERGYHRQCVVANSLRFSRRPSLSKLCSNSVSIPMVPGKVNAAGISQPLH